MNLHMAAHSLVTSVVAPGLVLAFRRSAPRVRPLAAWALFVGTLWVLNVPRVLDWITMRPAAYVVAAVVLVGVSFVFWAPLLGRRRSLRGLAAGAYLISAGMATDLIGAWYMAMGETVAGVVMVVGMIPLGVAAVVLMWTALVDEERRALRSERYANAAR